MTSDVDVFKTNEFLRRRKLRLQQVREQSKDIAKKIRQRAKVEKLRHITDLDGKKEQKYLDCQEKLVKRLELLYSKGLQNVGASHKNALEVSQTDIVDKTDLSKLRGREAAAEVRKRKQEKLDQQRKILDRKLQAREVANELSREKSSNIVKNLTKQTKKPDEHTNKSVQNTETNDKEVDVNEEHKNDNPVVTKTDMGTQWEFAELPNEWEPNIPKLSLPKDDTTKDVVEISDKSDKNKRLNLFALSDEMPSSLRGGLLSAIDETVPVKSSLNLVSEYLQNRNLRLREFEPVKRQTDDLQRIKQTILRTRASTADVSGSKDKSSRSIDPDIPVARKKSISIYNHNTRDVMDVPCANERFVIHDKKADEDAYTQALQETASASNVEKEKINKRQQDMRNKVALTRQNVDKEYRDTLAFLNSLPKDKGNKPIKTMYMDDQQQQLHKERYQRKMQQEFKKIEKECQKQNCKHNKRRTTVLERNRSLTKSPVNTDEQRRDFEYSWMPVPESDSNFAIHTIPTTKQKSGNTVKFSEPSSYHEYRSRHKHTPPTKESDERQSKRIIETVVLQQNSNGSDDNNSSTLSDSSSVENLNLNKAKNASKTDYEISDAERIIIYKILDARKKKRKNHKGSDISDSNKNNLISSKKHSSELNDKKQTSLNLEKNENNMHKSISFDQLQEGIYKGVSRDGDNIASMYYTGDKKVDEVQNKSKQSDNGKFCGCGNICSKITDKDIHNEEGDKRSRTSNVSCSCEKKTNENNLDKPSAASSMASFKTVPNDKTTNINPDSDFIKLINEGGHDTGKFYIGASGFIKDDNYEVVIQLRKKDGEKANTQENNDATSSVTEKQNTAEERDLANLSKNTKEIPIHKIASNVTSATSAESHNVIDTNDGVVITVEQPLNNEPTENINVAPIKKTAMCEKAVHTSFEDTYAIPVNVPKSDPLQRPATSTYTQTSFNSSLQRPAFMHMTSSTSTAYMSPPELVLPKFLRQNHIMRHDELFDSENTVNQLDSQYEVIEGDCSESKDCNCKQYSASVKKTTNFNIKCKERIASSTPPNTPRSYHGETYKENKRILCKHHKCRSNSQIKNCHKPHRKKTSSENTRSTKVYVSENNHVNFEQSKKHKMFSVSNNNADGNKINPLVKNYVNKLLALNKEGLKAIEIINQDCSVVSTPSSSIINVPSNNNKKHLSAEILQNKISLEQIKNVLKKQIMKENCDYIQKNIKATRMKHTESQTEKVLKLSLRLPKKRSVHKVKSLNISRQVLTKKKSEPRRPLYSSKMTTSTSSSTRDNRTLVTKTSRSKSSPTPRLFGNSDKNSNSSAVTESDKAKRLKTVINNWEMQINDSDNMPEPNFVETKSFPNKELNLRAHRLKPTYVSSDSEASSIVLKRVVTPQSSANTSTQTNGTIEVEAKFMKIAEDKLQNMEKIADLTEKCTKRLSNLAKVLEEVRRNKSLVYSQISTSDSASESDNKSQKNEVTEMPATPHSNLEILNKESQQQLASLTIPANLDEIKLCVKDSMEYTPFLKDIPKPESFVKSSNDIPLSETSRTSNITTEHAGIKSRGRPPPALSRINLKNGKEINVTPHELSTVIEVDSPMSLKHKNQSSRHETKIPDKSNQTSDVIDNKQENNVANTLTELKESPINPDILQTNVTIPRHFKGLSNDSSDDSKARTMDLKQFNNIMLKPFISLEEYAKQCNIGLDDGSNLEDVIKDDQVNDDLSSLHSDGSLPDVIAELLKRNMISEPFKFDSASNMNSTTLSSESTLSVLALSKTRKNKKKTGILFKNKENIGETSETLSISSNPDLENAFQKLGMGWASSTLKKTKERLALSSSSNTSSSSMTQFKIRSFSQEVPSLITDSSSSMMDLSHKRERKKLSPTKNSKDNSKNAVQQTSLTNSMTVKEFLTNELAKKITFSNKSTRKDADDDFMSLYETKMPEVMKHTDIIIQEDEDRSIVSPNNNRARTSTPVQIFKSTTYKSTSSSNTSDGLFSNADDLSSVKVTSASIRNHSTSDKDDLTIPNCTLKTRKELSDSKSD